MVTDVVHKPSRTVLAPSMGELRLEYLKNSDAALCKMIKLAMKELDQASVASDEELPWAQVTSIFDRCPFLVIDEESGQERHASFVKQSSHWFPSSGRSREDPFVFEVEARQWFKTLINNGDVLNATTVPLEFAQDMVAGTGLPGKGKRARTKGLSSQEQYRKNILYDVGVLRYPDSEYPYIRVYLFQVSTCRPGVSAIHDDNYNGLTGDFYTVKYRVRRAILHQT